MSIIEVLLSKNVLLAIMIYAPLSLLVLPISHFIYHRLQHALLEWLWEKILEPLFRVFLIVLFVCLAWPEIYGFTNDVPISVLLTQGNDRGSYLINILFLLTILLTLIPTLSKKYIIHFPLQAALASSLIFKWWLTYTGIKNVSHWPEVEMIFLVVIILLAAWRPIHMLANRFGEKVDDYYNVTGSSIFVYEALVLFLQFPIILMLCQHLGNRLSQ